MGLDEKAGGADHGVRLFSHPSCHHRPEVYGGIEEFACATILRDFLLLSVNHNLRNPHSSEDEAVRSSMNFIILMKPNH